MPNATTDPLAKAIASIGAVEVAPHDGETARKLRSTAFQCLSRHDHDWNFCGGTKAEKRENENLTRASCGACVLNGYQDRDDNEHDYSSGPNYAGWARIYVEAARAIPKKWHEAFKAELLRTDNPAYVEALKSDIATFGVRFEGGAS